MDARSTIRKRRLEAGVALLISIFILLLISVVAIALIVASGTETSLAGNYRSATGVYYAALAGLEEARGRLLLKDPNSFQNTAAGFLPSPGVTLAIGEVRYVLNPGPGDGNVLTAYPDTEYDNEFGPGKLAAANVRTTPSVWNRNPLNALPIPGPLYKWVRINTVSEQSLKLDVTPFDGVQDPDPPVFYDGVNLNTSNSGSQVLEITSLAVLPNGSQKLLQYLIAPLLAPLLGPQPLSFPAALTLDGNGVIFNTNTSGKFWVKGNDQYGALTCNPSPPAPAVTALGFTNPSDQANILSAIPSGPPPPGNPDLRSNYTNLFSPTPNVVQVVLPASLTTVAGLNTLVQAITQNADVPPITPSGVLSDGNNFMPAAMTATNPMTIVVNGDLTINGWNHHGYGLLLVTGKFTYDPDAYWHGIILVIGKGYSYSYQGSNAGGHIEGAVFIAKILDSSGNPLATLGPSQFDFLSSSLTPSGGNSYGVYYSNCWIQAAMPSYKILSFHEISQ